MAYMNEKKEACCHNPIHQAYQLLRLAFTILPIVAGADKFFNFFANWPQYLAPAFNILGNAHNTMMAVGIIEIIAGVGVWLKPQIFAYIVGLWLLAIIVNLLLLTDYYDIALRDFGLMLSAFALARLSQKHVCDVPSRISEEK